MSAERDPYVRHHRTFGGTAYVWLERAGRSRGGGGHAPAPRGRRGGADTSRGGRAIRAPPRADRRPRRPGRPRHRLRPARRARSRSSPPASAPTAPVTSGGCRSSSHGVPVDPAAGASLTRTTSISRVAAWTVEAARDPVTSGSSSPPAGAGLRRERRPVRPPRPAMPALSPAGRGEAREIADTDPFLVESVYRCGACDGSSDDARSATRGTERAPPPADALPASGHAEIGVPERARSPPSSGRAGSAGCAPDATEASPRRHTPQRPPPSVAAVATRPRPGSWSPRSPSAT